MLLRGRPQTRHHSHQEKTGTQSTRADSTVLRARPCSEEVVQGSIAVVGLRSRHMYFATSSFDGTASANVAFHLNLAVGQSAGIAPPAEVVLLGPFHAVNAERSLAPVGARRLATQRGNRGMRAASLEVLAAIVTLLIRPIIGLSVVAVVVSTALLMMLATPELERSWTLNT